VKRDNRMNNQHKSNLHQKVSCLCLNSPGSRTRSSLTAGVGRGRSWEGSTEEPTFEDMQLEAIEPPLLVHYRDIRSDNALQAYVCRRRDSTSKSCTDLNECALLRVQCLKITECCWSHSRSV
jgi:hypothetical protein